MDQLSAHLDRGWDLAQKGDGRGAEACGRRALEADDQSPEAHNLLGFALAMQGDVDDAIDHYKHAIALDDAYFEAMLNAAELLVHPVGDWDGAIGYCTEALDCAETDDEITECALVRVDALLGKGDLEEAKKTMAMIPSSATKNGAYMFLIGRAYFEVGEIEKAAALIDEAVKDDPENADAQYYRGLVRDEQGDHAGAVEAFLTARELDRQVAAPDWAMPPASFALLVRDVIEKLERVLSSFLQEAELYIVDTPGTEVVVEGVDPRAMVLIDPASIEAHEDDVVTAADGRKARARVFVYQRNVERAAGSADAVEHSLTAAFEREIEAIYVQHRASEPPANHQLN